MNGPTRRNTDAEDVITDRCLKCGLQITLHRTVAIETKSSVVLVYSTDINIIIALTHRDSAMGPSQMQ